MKDLTSASKVIGFRIKRINLISKFQYNTDLMFAHGIDQTARYHAGIQGSKNPVYYYKFCFDGALNLIKTVLLLGSYPGAMHADDIFYLWKVSPIPPPLLPTNSAISTRRRMVRMWTNFARNGYKFYRSKEIEDF